MKLAEIQEKLGRLVRQMRELSDAHPNGMPAEVEAKWNKLDEEYKAIYALYEREQTLAAREQQDADSRQPRDPHNPDLNVADRRAKSKRSAFRMLMEDGLAMTRKAIALRETDEDAAEQQLRQAAFERYFRYGLADMPAEQRALLTVDPIREKQNRAQTVTTTGGGYLIPQGFSRELETAMLAYGPMLDPALVRQIVTSSGNPLPWPMLDDTANEATQININTADTEVALTLGQFQLDAYKFRAGIVLVPNELLQDEEIGLDTIIRDAFAERFGRGINRSLTTGTGSSAPKGVVTASFLGVTAAAAAAVTWDELIDLEHSVDPAYRVGPSVGYMLHDATLKAIKKLKNATTGEYTWRLGDVIKGDPQTINGYKFWINQHMASMSSSESPAVGEKTILFGNFKKYIYRRVRDYVVIRLVERYAELDQVAFIAFERHDGDLLDAGTNPVKHLVHPTS